MNECFSRRAQRVSSPTCFSFLSLVLTLDTLTSDEQQRTTYYAAYVCLHQSFTSFWRNFDPHLLTRVHWGLQHLFVHRSLKVPPQYFSLLGFLAPSPLAFSLFLSPLTLSLCLSCLATVPRSVSLCSLGFVSLRLSVCVPVLPALLW